MGSLITLTSAQAYSSDSEGDIAADHLSVNSTIVALPDPNQVDHMIALTGTLHQLQQLLHHSRNY